MHQSIEIASRWRRFVAFIVDCNIVWYLTSLCLALIQRKYDLVLDEQRWNEFSWLIGNVIGFFFYFPIFTAALSATPGKLILGIRVVSNEGLKLPIGRSLLRETLGRWGSTLVLGHIWLLFNKRKKNAWDYLAESIVIKKYPKL